MVVENGSSGRILLPWTLERALSYVGTDGEATSPTIGSGWELVCSILRLADTRYSRSSLRGSNSL